MRKKLIILIPLILILLIIGCCLLTIENIVLPPTRIGEGKSYVTLANFYTFESAIAESDIVAHVRIGNWIGENIDSDTTYYEATIVEQFTGEEIYEIVLKQDGCSRCTYAGYPLFTSGNELLVFLKKSNMPEYDNAYWIIGSYTTVLYAVSDEKGNVYYLDRYIFLSDTAEGIINYIPKDSFAYKLFKKVIEEDPLLAGMTFGYTYLYSREDFKELVEKQ